MDAQKLLNALAQHHGSDQRYRHGLARNVLYTPGIQELAEGAGAYWLIDIVASAQIKREVYSEEFQLWTLKLNGMGGCTVTCKDDEPGNTLYVQHIEFTDFPLEEFSFYCCAEGDLRIALLKSEY